MRILFIAPIPFFYERGSCIRSKNIIETIIDLGHDVEMVTYPIGEDIDMPNLKIHRVKTFLKPPFEAKMSFTRLFIDYLLYRKALRLVKRKDYDCIMCKTPIGAWVGRKLKKRTGSMVLIDVVDRLSNLTRSYSNNNLLVGKCAKLLDLLIINGFVKKVLENIEKKNYKQADVIFANWDLVAKEVKELSDKDSFVLYNLISDKPKEAVDTLKRKYGIKDEKILMYTGAFTKQQGIDIMIESLKHLKNKNVKLMLVGPASESDKNLARKLKVEDKVIFVGQRPQKEMPDYLSISDVLLSAYYTGGLNATVKLLNYLFQKKPIVAANVPQYTQIVDEDVVYLAERSPEDFANKIDSILDNPDDAKKIALNAYNYANRKFSPEMYKGTIKKALEIVSKK